MSTETGAASGAATDIERWSDALLQVRNLDAGYGDLRFSRTSTSTSATTST